MFGNHMHHIQRAILLKLAMSSYMRFSQLQPPHVPNNTFSYHLKKLLELGYIEASPHGYSATRKALKIIQDLDGQQRHTRPVTLAVLFITNPAGEVLLIERDSQPFKNWLGAPSGIIHGGESLQQAAVRELYEKTTIIAEPTYFTSRGVLDFRYLQQNSNDMFIHAIGFVFTYPYTGKETLQGKQTKHGKLSWVNLATCSNVLPEVHAIATLSAQKRPLIQSIDFEEPLSLASPFTEA
jgi:8-oxo-dGTP pyrophosphatase MutT (NUDIX family)